MGQVNNMQSNYTIKQAVIAALTILAIGAQNNALALGLDNIEVKSRLGEPLRASIKIQGASELKDDTCFRVINDANLENQLTSANFKLSNVVDDVAILTVTTNQIINEPIANLSIMAECDANIRRDYVLLLDSPLSAETENTINEKSIDIVAENNVKTKNIAENPVQQQTVKVAAVSTKAAPAKKQTISKKSNKNIVLTAGYDVEKTADANNNNTANVNKSTPKNTANENKPHLSISGGELSSDAPNSANLILDKQLHFTPETVAQALAANIEVQDEATVMSHRLAHLEKQINTLVQANQKLKTENQVKTQRLQEVNSSNHQLDWLGYLLGGVLLASSYSIANKWRRRRQDQQLANAQALLVDVYNEDAGTLDQFEQLSTDDDFFENDSGSNSRQKFNSAVEKSAEKNSNSETTAAAAPFSVEEFNSEHNILDHADVFLSHGRTSLAIQLLQNHLLEFPKQSVTIWLFLLDLIAKENLQALYEQTALECKEHFNIRIAAFSNDEASPKQCLEDFPRLASGLQDIWGTPAAVVYLDDLIYNSRLETRVGFDKSVLEELLMLKSIAHDAISTASVIQLDEKKLAMKEMKEAQIAAKKAEKMQQMDEIVIAEVAKKQANAKFESKEAMFDFNLVEYNN